MGLVAPSKPETVTPPLECVPRVQCYYAEPDTCERRATLLWVVGWVGLGSD
jgi:hypothetical protein